MRNISDLIEQHLKLLLMDSQEGAVEIQRNDLAQQFSCVPSQINYVINTRFTLEKGFLVESKRGGGGYVRIQRISLPSQQVLQAHVCDTIGNCINQESAEGLIYQLEDAKVISHREANLLRAAISRDHLPIKLPYRDELRARLFRAMLLTLLND